MASENRASIFISYAHSDGMDLATRLGDDLSQKGFEVWLDKDRIAGGACWTKEIEGAIDQSQVILALLTPGSYISEICRAEQLRSLRKGKCVIPVLAIPGSDIPLHLETKNYRDFAGSVYGSTFEELLQDISARKGVRLK